MRTRVSGLLISNLSRNLLHFPKPPTFLPLSADYSTNPNRRPMDSSTMDDRSEELFFQNLDFGDKSELGKEEKNDRNPSSPIPGRPLRGERTVDVVQEDLFPDFNDKQRGKGRGRSSMSSMRTEGIEGVRPLQQKSGEGFSFLAQKTPSFSALHSNRGQERSDGFLKKNDQEKGGDGIGETLFEKLKLGHLGNGGRNQTSRSRSALQPNRGEERSDGLLKKNDQGKGGDGICESLFEKLKLGSLGNGGRNQTAPSRSALQPNRGEEKSDGSLKKNDQEKGEDRIGESLFEKLKLGDLGSGERNQSSTTAAAGSTEPESPPEDADEIFKKMKDTGLIPNAVSMLDGLCKDGLVQEAMKLFGLMREKGTIPEVVIYTAVVEGFCKAAKFDDAKRIFRKMEKNGIVPNAFSYWILIQGLCKGKKLEDAVEFCMELVAAGHSPNSATFTGLVDVYSKEKGVKEAEELVRKLRERGFAPDERALREYLDKKGPYSPMVWEAIFGKKISQRPF